MNQRREKSPLCLLVVHLSPCRPQVGYDTGAATCAHTDRALRHRWDSQSSRSLVNLDQVTTFVGSGSHRSLDHWIHEWPAVVCDKPSRRKCFMGGWEARPNSGLGDASGNIGVSLLREQVGNSRYDGRLGNPNTRRLTELHANKTGYTGLGARGAHATGHGAWLAMGTR